MFAYFAIIYLQLNYFEEFQEDQKGIFWLLKKSPQNATQKLILIVESFNSIRGNSKG